MANNVQNDVEDEGTGFNARQFALDLYKSIDSYRSQMSSNPFEVVANPKNNPGGVGETKINAFYRMIGLPAATDPTFINAKAEDAKKAASQKRDISQDGTLNYVTSINSKDASMYDQLKARDRALTTKINTDRFATFMYDPISISAGTKLSTEGQNSRASIFPLVVDASVPVYPLSRRLAPSFQHSINGEDYIVSGSTTRLSRPLIDNIIYMRTKCASNVEGEERLRKQIDKLVKQAELDAADRQIETDIMTQKNTLTFIELSIKTKLLQILKSLAVQFKEVANRAKELESEVTFHPTPVSNPAQRSSQNSAYDASLNLKATVGSLDSQIALIKLEIVNQTAIAYMLPTEEVKRREEIRRLEHMNTTTNIVNDVLISQLNSLITSESVSLNERLADLNRQRDEKISEAEQYKQLIMYYTGEFSGLSIFDVICVIYGLFSIEFKHLIGLLNADAQKRLAEDEFFRSNDTTSAVVPTQIPTGDAVPSISESLKALEEKVREAFKISEGFSNIQALTQ